MTTVDWPGFLITAGGISLIPGANQLLGLHNAYRYGAATAMVAVLGRLAAFAVMVVLVALGLGALLVRSETTFDAVKWCGVAYLAFLGLQSWWQAYHRGKPAAGSGPDGTPPTPTVAGTWYLTRQEFTVAATNPKAVFLFAALLPQFVHGTGSLTRGLVVVGCAYIGVEALYAALYASVGSRLHRIAVTPPRDRVIQRIAGTCLLGFAAYLGLFARAPGR